MKPRAIMVCFAWVLCAVRAFAGGDPLAAAGSLATASSPSHGWFVVQTDSLAPWALMHVTPRRTDEPLTESAVPRGISVAGQARFAVALESLPMGMAAVEDAAYLLFDGDTLGASGLRRIFRVRAERDRSGAWRTLPLGRLEFVDVLPRTGDVLAFGACERGPVLVVRSVEGASAWLLANSRWRELVLPAELARGIAGAVSVHVLAAADSVSLLVEGGESWNQWSAGLSWPTGAIDPDSGERVSTIWDAPEGPLPLAWKPRIVPALGTSAGEVMRVFLFADTLVATRWKDPDGLSLEILDPVTGWKSVARAAHVPRRCASVPLFDASHLLVAWTAEDDRGRLSRRGWEVSVPAAAVLHDGPLKLGGPVSKSEYRMLVLILLMVTSSTLTFVLTPEERRAFQLPFGFSLARTSRRVAAAALDVALCVAISQGVFVAVGPGVGGADQGPVAFFDAMLGALVCAFVLGVTSEAVSGRTPGKMVMGLRVIAVARVSSGELIAQQPGFGRAMIRNLLKCGALPLALIGVFDSGGRGRPDQIAGTVVAVADEDEPDPDEDSM